MRLGDESLHSHRGFTEVFALAAGVAREFRLGMVSGVNVRVYLRLECALPECLPHGEPGRGNRTSSVC